MRFLRSVLGVTLRDKLRNKDRGEGFERENIAEEIIQC
jgi:hypothetical protein